MSKARKKINAAMRNRLAVRHARRFPYATTTTGRSTAQKIYDFGRTYGKTAADIREIVRGLEDKIIDGPEGIVLLDIDYSAIEMRILAMALNTTEEKLNEQRKA